MQQEHIRRTIEDIRNDFPLLIKEPTAYLDNAATAHKPACVLKAEEEFYVNHNANPMRGFYPLSIEATDIYENARKGVRAFIGAASEREIVFTRNATESLNLVAYSYGLNSIKAGDEIVVAISEHHSNMLPWQMAARVTGAELRYLECGADGSYSDEEIEKVIGERTKLVAIAQVSNVLGRCNPLEKIIGRVHENGGVAVIDASQSIPHMQVDVKKLDADFLVFSGHKLLGPMGIGVLYGKEELLDAMPPFLTGGEMIDSVRRDGAVYAELPHKFEAGTVNAAGAAGLAEAIRYINGIGYDHIKERDELLTQRAIAGLKDIPHVNIIGSDKAEEHNGIITFTIDDVHPHDISEILASEGVDIRAGHHCAQPLHDHLKIRSTARASLMFYNTEEEVDRFLRSIAGVRSKLGWTE